MKCTKLLKITFAIFTATIFYCEYFVYYLVLSQCKWPELSGTDDGRNDTNNPVRAMILADTHLLGPIDGHWLDRAYREWHMHRAFQTTINLFQPETVFILGDIFDEGYFVNDKQFRKYVLRFHKLFKIPVGVRLICAVGNHDVGFHYWLDPYYTDRFADEFSNVGVNLYTIKNVHFVVINSMAMENDGCYLCERALEELKNIEETLSCLKTSKNCNKHIRANVTFSRPILMQHFPLYRLSDKMCDTHDSPKIEKYKEGHDVLSKESTELLGRYVHPRLAFSGHSHHYCELKSQLGIPEYTIASFNWRHKDNPSFLLALFTPTTHSISKCNMPTQNTAMAIYVCSVLICISFGILKTNLLSLLKYNKSKRK